MIKIDVKNDLKQANEFVAELKKNPELKDCPIDLNNANDYALYLEEKEHCRLCKGLKECKNSTEGYQTVLTKDGFALSSCDYRKEMILKDKERNLIQTLFVSKQILKADLASFDVTPGPRERIYKYIVEWIQAFQQEQFKKGLYLFGNFSTGKTFILGCIANELARHKIESLIIYFPDLVVELKNAIGTPRFEELIRYLKDVPVLFLDDLGSENMTPWLRDEILGPILNYRLMEEKPLFISSNFDISELEEYFTTTKSRSEQLKAQRVVSRLKGLVISIELENTPYKR